MSDWPIASEEDRGGRMGVNLVGLKVQKLLKWIFRETSSSDLGVDGEIEIRNQDETSHGRLVSVQIKCGVSFLNEQTNSGYVFRGAMKHLRYWLGHTAPVIVILCNPDSEVCWWTAIDLKKINIHEKGWSIEVPFENELNASACAALIKVANRLQKKDFVELLLRDWLGWSFRHQMRLASWVSIPRDYHWFSHLGAVGEEYYMLDYVLSGVGEFNSGEVDDMLRYAASNHSAYGYKRFLLAFISESPALLKRMPEPKSISGVIVEYVPLLLDLTGEPALSEVGRDGRLIVSYDGGDPLDANASTVEFSRKIRTA